MREASTATQHCSPLDDWKRILAVIAAGGAELVVPPPRIGKPPVPVPVPPPLPEPEPPHPVINAKAQIAEMQAAARRLVTDNNSPNASPRPVLLRDFSRDLTPSERNRTF